MATKDLGLKKQLREADKEGRAIIMDGLPYEVGFAKPPTGTRFKTGNQHGRGRQKGSKNLSTIIKEEFDEKVKVTENGTSRKMSKKQILVRQVANKGAAGDHKAILLSFDLMRRAGEFSEPAPTEVSPFDARDFEAVRECNALSKRSKVSVAEDDEGGA
jgi:hypothetical protein